MRKLKTLTEHYFATYPLEKLINDRDACVEAMGYLKCMMVLSNDSYWLGQLKDIYNNVTKIFITHDI